MVRDLTKTLHIALDQLGCAVVVVQQGEESVDNGMVDLSQADVNAEEGMDNSEQRPV